MTELQVDFRSFNDWKNWVRANRKHFDFWRDECLGAIKMNGIEEPLTNMRRVPAELLINENNLSESISYNGLNGRRRAGLYGIELCLDLLNEGQRKNPRVLAAEAVTAPARILSYKFPFFVGTEYLPTKEQQERFFPIRHLDVQDINFTASSFDIFYGAAVLEYVPDIGKCFREILRVLKPGGVMVSTFRFLQNMPLNQVRADLGGEGEVRYLMPPQYQANPVSPGNDKLVYTIPGWEIIETAKQTGFEDAKLTYILSARYGILNRPSPGIFVFCAVKGQDKGVGRYLRTNHGRQNGSTFSPPEKLVGVISLPRSGSTMLASIFSVHPKINTVYEPWNGHEAFLMDNMCLHSFYDVLPGAYEESKSVLLVKETTTKPWYIQRMKRLLDSTDSVCSRKFIVLLRNPFHIYLSEIEARVKWWGNPEAAISTETFDLWAWRSIRSIFQMLELAERYNGLLVSYEYLMANPSDSIVQLMDYLEVSLDERQFNFQHHMDMSKVRGDPKMSDSSSGVDASRQVARDDQFEQIEPIISKSEYYSDICKLRDYVEELARVGSVSHQEFQCQIGIAPARYMPI
jgi:SAM-dependent methyltransferase